MYCLIPWPVLTGRGHEHSHYYFSNLVPVVERQRVPWLHPVVQASSIGVLGQGSSTNAQPSHITVRRRPTTRMLRRQPGAHCNKRQPPTRNSAPNCCCSAVEPRQFIGYTPPKQDVWPWALQASSAACKYDFDMRFSCTQLTPLF